MFSLSFHKMSNIFGVYVFENIIPFVGSKTIKKMCKIDYHVSVLEDVINATKNKTMPYNKNEVNMGK